MPVADELADAGNLDAPPEYHGRRSLELAPNRFASPTPARFSHASRPEDRAPASRLFLWCAGVAPDLIDTGVERHRYVGIDVFIVLNATLSVAMFALLVSVINAPSTRCSFRLR
jgi:hypothetical protein